MITVKLHGHLRKTFGPVFKFEARTVKEAMQAMQANFPSFKRELCRENRCYHVVVNKKEDYANKDKIYFPIGRDSIIDIIPAVEGGGNIFASIALVIIGILLIVYAAPLAGALASGFTAGSGAALGGALASGAYAGTAIGAIYSAIGAIGYGLISMGVASLLAPDAQKIQNEGEKKSSSAFSGTDNTVGEGVPVPIGYGRLRIGTNVVSAINESSLNGNWRASSTYNYDTGEITDVYYHGDDILYRTTMKNALGNISHKDTSIDDDTSSTYINVSTTTSNVNLSDGGTAITSANGPPGRIQQP